MSRKKTKKKLPNRTATRKAVEPDGEAMAERWLHGYAHGLRMAYKLLADGCELDDIRVTSDAWLVRMGVPDA
ncbi:hypothetical protein [Isoptericola sp. NPDC057391]|uniref:hypothetical protein n=1 Tax=Isoptericola sp. NPDC057391 TaxID=3346117 RepID=UPI00362A380B